MARSRRNWLSLSILETLPIRPGRSGLRLATWRDGIRRGDGLGYSLLVFVYDKADDPENRTANLNIVHAIFIDAAQTGDFPMTKGLREIIAREGNEDDLAAFMQDKVLPVDEIDARRLAQEILSSPPEQGTQRAVGDETSALRIIGPKTWEYLQIWGRLLDRRASSVYRNRPRFSVFGVGDYTFAPWKVAISGFYKKLQFAIVGPHEDRPVVLDDTCYFVACQSEQEAQFVAGLLNSRPARSFFSALVFWDAKRPITIELLRRLDLWAMASELGSGGPLAGFQAGRREARSHRQPGLF